VQVVGAGLGRTGTLSLKLALTRLLGGPCYHMLEVYPKPEHVAAWHAAAQGRMPDWKRLFDGYRATVDWPAASFWREISAAFPNALILLSLRDPESWWRSAHDTIFTHSREMHGPWREMVDAFMAARFTPKLDDRAASIAAFERHNAEVRREAPRERLLEWRAGDGWAPLCQALGVPVPSEPFPHVNKTDDFVRLSAQMRAARA
jgi:hypothetical protein